ncbi:hypothetical protein DSO57_1036566 [Entomophthora muscae]|uniref:Uncharacterized protein n=1 Tax=Entomophthora muscae TaxID=34485 RepID=A0ACC2RQ61_9FUNG|nr:hypothetical protein DSO57_1036566 [Entomophthora muscae]
MKRWEYLLLCRGTCFRTDRRTLLFGSLASTIKRTNCLAVSGSPNGPSLATGGSDKVVGSCPKLTAKALNKQEVLFEHRLHKADIRAVQWSSDNQTGISDKAATPATNRQRMLREK